MLSHDPPLDKQKEIWCLLFGHNNNNDKSSCIRNLANMKPNIPYLICMIQAKNGAYPESTPWYIGGTILLHQPHLW